MTTYRLDLAQLGSSGLGTVILADFLDTIGVLGDADLVFNEVLNQDGSLEFSLPIDHNLVTTDNFAVGRRELHLYRNDVLVWGGKLWTADVQGWEVRFIGYGWEHDLGKRVIGADYAVTDTDQFDIVRALVDATQVTSSLGLTHYNLADSTITRKFVVCVEQRRTVRDAINELSAAQNGFDYAVTADKKLRMWYPRRGDATTVVFGDSNMATFRYEVDGDGVLTAVGILGPDEECGTPSLYVAGGVDVDYGLIEGTADDGDILDDDLREQTAEELLRINTLPRFQPDVSIETALQEVLTAESVGFNDVRVGDTITVETTRGAAGGFGYLNMVFRVVSRRVHVKAPGFETITYGLDQTVGS
jgi:hypothetical protein